MSYQNASIAETVAELNVNYFLPAIQREYVWDPARVIMLFDSIMRQYPIGSLLFWKLKTENVGTWEFYDFVKKARQGSNRCTTANIAGVANPMIVLDGQQRLTSMLVGLRGSYELKKKHMRWNNPAAWQEKYLCLDLLRDPDAATEDGEEGIRYGLDFFVRPAPQDSSHFSIEVGEILRCDSDVEFETYRSDTLRRIEEVGYTGDRRVPERNLDRLNQVIWREKSLAYFVEIDQDYDRVLDIFVRANQGAVRLSKSDLLLSMMTARWSHSNARREVYDFVDHINDDLPRRNSFDKDFVMKSCLVLCDLPVAYQVRNFGSKNLELIAQQWDVIKDAIERAVRLVNHLGLDRDTLTSANALIPLAYYFKLHPQLRLTGTSSFEDANARRAQRWLLAALLNAAFSGQSDSILTAVRQALKESAGDEDFPLASVNDALVRQGRRAGFDDETVGMVLDNQYGHTSTFLALALLHDAVNLGQVPHHQDHIFPKSWFTEERLEGLGVEPGRRSRFLQLADSLANLQLLTETENAAKQAQDPLVWLRTRAADFRREHLIPDDDELLTIDRFDDFINERQVLISERLRNLFAPLND